MSWEKLSDAAAEAAVWSIIADVAKDRKDAARAWLTAHMGPEAVAVKAIANGTDVGRATWVEGKSKPVVTDEREFKQYVQDHFPSELITTVNPAFQRQFLSNVQCIDGEPISKDGEWVPGVSFREPEPYVAVRKSASARATVDALLSSGQLQLGGLAEVTGGDPDGK